MDLAASDMDLAASERVMAMGDAIAWRVERAVRRLRRDVIVAVSLRVSLQALVCNGSLWLLNITLQS
jgi:hypothetical protein